MLTMERYIKREMRFRPDVRVRQSFRVNERNVDFAAQPLRTPIIINNFNRLVYLQALVDSLRSMGYENLYVIDNASTYGPLHDYYETSGLRVFYLTDNVGYLALWRTEVFKNFIQNHYVYTDPDVLPSEKCPHDFLALFYQVLRDIPRASKTGFGLRLDDLPNHNPLKSIVLEHEMPFWENPLNELLYAAPIDTTFALYRPKTKGGWWLPAIRTGAPFVARHLPWYENPADPTAEQSFYLQTVQHATHWSDFSRHVVSSWPPARELQPWSPFSALFEEVS